MEVRTLIDATEEPVTINEVKNFCRIDDDYYGDDEYLTLAISASREKLEKALNLTFVPKTLEVQFGGGCIDLPYGPIISIITIYNAESSSIDPIEYTSTGLDFKKIFFGNPSNYEFFYKINNPVPEIWRELYVTCLSNCIYEAGYVELPKLLKQALLIQIDYDLKNQGKQADDVSQLAIDKAKSYSRNLYFQ